MLQTIRWSLRSHDANEKLAMSTEARDGSIQVVVNALDRDDASLSTLNLSGTAVQPDGSSHSFTLEQAAPGRYVAKLPASDPGNYYLAVAGSGRSAPLRAAVNVATTAELRRLTSYDGYLAEIAEGVPRGGERGKLIQASHGIADTQGLLATDVFRPGVAAAKSRSAMWPLLLVATSVLFLGDIFCRRVLVSFDWVQPFLARWGLRSGQPVAGADASRMERLRKSKSTATAQFTPADGATRFEPSVATATVVTDIVEDAVAAMTAADSTAGPVADTSPAPDDATSADYTSRLLEAKKRVRDNQQRPN